MFGSHVGRQRAKGKRPSIVAHLLIAKAQAEAVGVAFRAFQIFVAGPRQRRITLTEEEAKELEGYLSHEDIWGVGHSAYAAYPWRDDHKARHAAKFVRQEARRAKEAGLQGLVVHLPQQPADVLAYLPRLFDAEGARIYLETPSLKPENSHYETVEKLAELFRQIREQHDPDLTGTGLCIDTAHLWACGVDLSSREDAAEWLEQLEAAEPVIPSDRIMFHLNDSARALGSGVDCHEGLLQGNIWQAYADCPGKSGLAAFVEYAVRHNIPTILERRPASVLSADYMALHRLSPESHMPDDPAA